MGSQRKQLSRRHQAELERIVGKKGVRTDATARAAYESDAFMLQRANAEVIVLPRTTEEAAAAIKVIREAGLVVVPRGAGTGLSGGARPVENGAIVGTARMRDVIEVNAEDRYARVQAEIGRASCRERVFRAV